MYIYMHEVIGTALILFCGDRQRTSEQDFNKAMLSGGYLTGWVPIPFAAWYVYHQLSLLASTPLCHLWRWWLLICLAQLLGDALRQPSWYSWALLGPPLPEDAKCVHAFWGSDTISQRLSGTLSHWGSLSPVWSVCSCEEIAASKKTLLSHTEEL